MSNPSRGPGGGWQLGIACLGGAAAIRAAHRRAAMKEGNLYASGTPHIIRSKDNGATWTESGAYNGFISVIGDGTTLYTAGHGGGHFLVAKATTLPGSTSAARPLPKGPSRWRSMRKIESSIAPTSAAAPGLSR